MNKPGKRRPRQPAKKNNRRKVKWEQEYSSSDEEETVTEPYEPQVIQMLEKVMSELDGIKKSQSNFEQRLAEINDEIKDKVEAHSTGIFEQIKNHFIHPKQAETHSDSPGSAYGGGTTQKESAVDAKGTGTARPVYESTPS